MKATLEKDLNSVRASADASVYGGGSATAEAEASERNRLLEQKVQELECKLQEAQGWRHAEAEVAKNRGQNEAIAIAEHECLALQQQIEEKSQEKLQAREADAQLT